MTPATLTTYESTFLNERPAAYALPNGLVVDFQSDGDTLVSISQKVNSESKENLTTITGFSGIRYDGNWVLLKPE